MKFITIKSIFLLILLSLSLFIGTNAEAAELLGAYPPRINASTPAPLQNADIIKIVAIRVEFQTDTLSGTTGDGTFGSAIADTIEVDPLPHNRKYFQDQLLFLKNFYHDISNGEVFLDTSNAVFPISDSEVYTLPYPMWHYNHNDEEYLDYGLAALFYDAWKAADEQNSDINFSQYDPDHDLFIVFHAGVGKDFAFDYDPTPFDIPSAYIDTDDLVEALQNPFLDQGIPVDNDSAFVKRGMILPECESQEGYELGMHGHMVLLMGHQIGMPNLFNTETGSSVLGWFGMMDQGSGKLDGLVPAPPSAWMKVKMGWTEVQEVTSFPDSITIPVGTIIKVPITNKEYFLLENIDSWVRPGVSWDSLQYSYYVEHNQEYPETFALLQYHVSQYMEVVIDPESGVLTYIENWGVGRPASGILIWHIDENVIDDNIDEGTINNDPDHLGVFLEEADGAMDIGQNYGFFSAGYGTELGYPWDAFWGENKYHLDANPHKNEVSFGDDTFPDAKSNSGAFSHLLFHSFSDTIKATMEFVVENDLYLPGFPKTIPITIQKSFAANIDGQPGDEILSYGKTDLYGWFSSGEPIPSMQGSTILGHIYTFSDTISSMSHTVTDVDTDGMDEFFLASDDSLYRFSFTLTDSAFDIVPAALPAGLFYDTEFMINDSLLYFTNNEELFCWHVSGDQLIPNWTAAVGKPYCLLPDNSVIAGRIENSDYVLRKIDCQGNEIWNIVFNENEAAPSAITGGDIDRDGKIEFVCKADTLGDYLFNDSTKVLMIIDDNGDIIRESEQFHLFKPIFADFDNDDFLDILTVKSTTSSSSSTEYFSTIEAYHPNGTLVDYFPWEIEGIIRDPVLIAEDNNGYPAVIFYQTDVFFNGFDHYGNNLSGFPISFPGMEESSWYYSKPVLFKSPDNSIGLLIQSINSNSDNSTIYAVDTGLNDILWGSYNGNKGNTNCLSELYASLPQTGSLMPADQVYNWPNPNNPGENFTNIRYYLNYDANIKIDIYDMAGDKVDKLTDYGIAQDYNETVWNLDNISSGVYFARVEANGGGQNAVQFIKIAVLK